MATALDVSSSAIRLAERRDGRLVRLDEWPVPAGADPLTALAACPLPRGLGPVRVALAHDDLLLRTMSQPDGPDERLDRLIRFDAAGLGGDEPASVAWLRLPGDAAEARVLVQVTRRRLIDRVRQALAPHGATLAALLHPATALASLLETQAGDEGRTGTEAIVDIGGRHLHIALLRHGRIVLLRSHQPGLEALVEEVAALRGIAPADARRLIRHLSEGSPDDLKDLVRRQAAQVSAAVVAATRFARTQLDLPGLEPERLLITGAGALAHGFVPALASHAGVPVRLVNPFAGQSLGMTTEDLDRCAGLPSSWTVAIGASQAAEPVLDALADDRRERRAFWRGPGALAAASVVAAVLAVTGAGVAEVRAREAEALAASLQEALPQVRDLAARQERARAAQATAASRILWLDAQRRLSRIAPELLGVIGSLQDPSLCPVLVRSATFNRLGGGVQADLEGRATAGTKGTAAALHTFEAGLTSRYPVIARLEALPMPIGRDYQPFRYQLTIPDTTP